MVLIVACYSGTVMREKSITPMLRLRHFKQQNVDYYGAWFRKNFDSHNYRIQDSCSNSIRSIHNSEPRNQKLGIENLYICFYYKRFLWYLLCSFHLVDILLCINTLNANNKYKLGLPLMSI